ncbi:transposase [Neochlamydia sp. EPS4]|uniref:DUF6444 domain-containing protein n=1 Tax=Neochlamydia sp. EPS4 TaxID=1478175 RepID=UPI0005D10291|nr:transposase [Neochlamydia sp. EPS4]
MQPSYKQLFKENAELKAAVIKLKKIISKLEVRMAQLDVQINQNSKNSSEPPSTDRKASRSSTLKTENRPYHPGANRDLLPASAVISHDARCLKVCPQYPSAMQMTDKVFSWQQIELHEIKPLVHQIDLVTCRWPHCQVESSPELKENKQFLLGLKKENLTNLLMGQYRQEHRAVRTLITALLPKIVLSQGLICKVKALTATLLSSAYETIIKAAITTRQPLYIDATSWRHAAANEHLLVLSVGDVIAYALRPYQNSFTLKALVGQQIHCLISDRGLANHQIEVKIRQYCLAHLICNIQGQAEQSNISLDDTQRLATVCDTLQELFKDKHRLEKGQISPSTWQQYGYLNWRYIQEKLQDLQFKGSTKKQIKYFRAYLKDPEIPMTNNAAEESLRNLVIARKLCLGRHAVHGKRWREVLNNWIETLYRQGKFILDFLADAICSAYQAT